MNLDKLLDNLQAEANAASLSSFDGTTAAAIKADADRKGLSLNEYFDSMKTNLAPAVALPGGGDNTVVSGQPSGIVSTVNIDIVRNNAVAGDGSLRGALPAIIGVPDSRLNDYQDIAGEYVAPGITGITVQRNGSNLRLNFTDGTNQANVDISMQEGSFNTFLQGLITNRLAIEKIRYKVPSGQLAQLDQRLVMRTQTAFGKVKTDSLTPAQFKSPSQNQNDVVDINVGTQLGAVAGYVALIAAATTQTTTLTLYVRGYTEAKF